MSISHLILRRLKGPKSLSLYPFCQIPPAAGFSTAADSTNQSPTAAKPSSLSARMSFIFEQIDEIDRKREDRDETLQRIRAWRESKKQQAPVMETPAEELKAELVKSEALLSNRDAKKEVELVHPWPEWVELMERLVQQNYFDHRRKDEDGMMEGLGLNVPEASMEDSDKRLDFTQNFKTVQTALVNFGRDRFDILRSLSRSDLQILVGYGCPSADKKVSYSGKLLRKHVHLDEGDVCSSCSLRSSCEKAYLLTNKEDEARTIDVMRILLAYGFDAIDGSVANKSLSKMKPVKAVVRKLIHDVVKLSAVPIDPNLTPPVIKKPPPKVKQPPPPPRKRVGRSDVEMKKGDWLCPKCDFLNFAKNNVCLQCDAKRPKRQLLPGEWECPQCNFLNYRRNTACFHCEHKRPPETYAETQYVSRPPHGPRAKMDHRSPNRRDDISNAWNFDFDDNESDGADVAAFEYADSQKIDEDFQLGLRAPKAFERESPDPGPSRPGLGFNDFDDDLDSYEVISPNEAHRTPPRIDFSELEADSESEDMERTNGDNNWHGRGKDKYPTRGKKQMHQKASFSDDEDVGVSFDTDDDLAVHPDWKSSHVGNQRENRRERRPLTFVSDDDDDGDGDADDNLGFVTGSEDETFQPIKRGNGRGGSYGTNNRRGGRSGFTGRSFSEADSDDEPSYRHNNQRNKSGRGGSPFRKNSLKSDFDSYGMNSRRGGRSGFRGRSFSEADSDDEPSSRHNNQRNKGGRGGSPFRKNSMKSDLDSGPRRSNGRGSRENSYNGQSRNAKGSNSSSRKFQSHNSRQDGSYDKRGGRSKYQSDSYLDNERHLRPRVNVR